MSVSIRRMPLVLNGLRPLGAMGVKPSEVKGRTMGDMVRQSYTALSAEGMMAVVAAQRHDFHAHGEKYTIELNASDFQKFASVLHQVATDAGSDPGIAEWAGSWLSDMAETLGIEFI